TELLRVDWIQRVFHVDERGHAAGLLRFCDHLQRDGGFARRFGAEDLGNSPSRKASGAESIIERDGAARNGCDRYDGFFRAQPQDGAFTELFFDLAERQCESPAAFFFVHVWMYPW